MKFGMIGYICLDTSVWRKLHMFKKLFTQKQSQPDEAEHALTGSGPIPEHIAIIMDGNGRWATKRSLPRIAGHHEGMKTSKKVHQVQIDALTEMKDIVSWLPNIAAGANLAEAKWNEVNSESKSMEDLFEKQITTAGSLDLKRQAYRKNAKTIQDCIARLETAIESS